jgi:DNA replication ATP-dependent helicase Dna2
MVVERLFDFNNLGHHDEFFKLKHEFEQLNHGQKSAVYKAFLAQDYALIQGFPGTGKTSVITFLARLLVAHGKRVLITAYTHSAVDNIMMKLMEKGLGVKDRETKLSPLLRIGRQQSCHASIKSIIHTELAANYHQSLSTSTNADGLGPCAAAFRTVIDAARIVGVSALTLPRSSLLREEHFDVVIVDEAGQMNQPATLGVLTAADSFVLVGDHKQLPPLVNSEIAEAGGFGDSMMKCLADCHPSSVVQLTTQYRMNDAICRVASEAFYDNLLQCSGEEQKTMRLVLPQLLSNIPGIADEDACWPWLQRIIDPSNPVVFVDTDKVRTTSHHLSLPQQHQHTSTMEPLEVKIGTSSRGSIVNHTEATFVKKIVEGLHGYGGLDLTSVGIISPFRAQIKIMESMPVMERWKYKGMEISTVDSYQGRDKPTIIMSLVRSNLNGNAGRLLQDDRRLNVALTRAKHKLIIVGSFSTLRTGSTPLMPILDSMKQRNEVVVLPQNALEQCAL